MFYVIHPYSNWGSAKVEDISPFGALALLGLE